MEAAALTAVGSALMVAGYLIGTAAALALIFIGGMVLGIGISKAVSR